VRVLAGHSKLEMTQRYSKSDRFVGARGFERTPFSGFVSRAIYENLGELADRRNAAQREGTAGDGAGGNWEAMKRLDVDGRKPILSACVDGRLRRL
jgi:hypothetical protein